MSTLLSARINEDEAKKLDELANALDIDRPSLLRRLIRRAYREEQLERALQLYRDGEISLSRAAEMAELNLSDMLLRLAEQKIELNYGMGDLNTDVEAALR